MKQYTRGEKALLLVPLFMALAGGGLWLRDRILPTSFDLSPYNSVGTMVFSPDGGRLALIYRNKTDGADAGQIVDLGSGSKVCDLMTPLLLTAPNLVGNTDRRIYSWATWSGDGTRIVAAYRDGSRGQTKVPNPFWAVKGEKATVANEVAKVAVWETRGGQIVNHFLYAPTNEDSYSPKVRFSVDGKALIGERATLSTFDAQTGERLRVVRGGFRFTDEIRQDTATGLVAEINRGRTRLQVYDPKTKRVLWTPAIQPRSYLQWGDGVLAALGFAENSVAPASRIREDTSALLLYDAKTRRALPRPPLPTGTRILNFAFRPKANQLAMIYRLSRSQPAPTPSGAESELVVWDYHQNRVLWRAAADSILLTMQWSPDGKWISVVANGSSVEISRLIVFDRNGKRHIEREVSEPVTAWSPDSQHIATILQSRVAIVPVGE